MEYKLRRNLLIFALLVAVSLLVVVSIIAFAGNGGDSKKILGSWKETGSENAKIEFFENGTYNEVSDVPFLKYNGDYEFTGTYKFEGGGIIKLYPADDPSAVWSYRYIVSDNFLSLENVNKYEDKRIFSR